MRTNGPARLNHPTRLLITGSTGYIGGRLVPRLLERGYGVRCLVRDARKLAQRSWASDPRVEVVEADAADEDALTEAMRGCSAAYYLIHSMVAAGPEYRTRDRELAETFARAAERASLQRILYLGGLGETGDGLSQHLSSRREVELALASRAVPVTVLRAAMIIGIGSASFEILRYLVERLPIMVTPRWVSTECQPISIRDALSYLVAAIEEPATTGRTLDIGGADVVTYLELMQIVAETLALPRRRVIPVPVLTPHLSSLWIHIVTPVDHRIAQPLAEGLRNRVVCRNDDAIRLMPFPLATAQEAIEAALATRIPTEEDTSWLDAGKLPGDPEWAGGTVFRDTRSIHVSAPRSTVFATLARIGGAGGWFGSSWLWRLRGVLDRLIGGPGLGRGRRHRDGIMFGDVIDFWRATDVRWGELLELRAEMKLPGEAELSFRVEPCTAHPDRSCSILEQTARFRPRGLLGIAYWYSVSPFHALVFRGMIRGIRRAAEQTPREVDTLPSEPLAAARE